MQKKTTKTRGQTSERNYCAIARRYAEDVVAGKVLACKWVRLACERQIADLTRGDWRYNFDPKRAIRVCRFVELLPHVKGKWDTPLIRLEPWQIFILCVLFGWIDDNGNRRFRVGYIEVPRKNGKSALMSGIGLYLLAADDEPGSEVYSAATTRDQARIVFETAKKMAERTPGMCRRFGVEVGAHAITVPAHARTFQALSSDAHTLEGLNVHGGLVDELHAHPTREVWDVIESATGARSQPLLLAITTAGSNRAGICYEQRTYVTKILERIFADETYFGIIYTIDEGDDWQSEDSQRKSNPNYGISVNPEDLHRKAAKAAQMPSALANFLTKHNDVWISADAGLFDMQAWEACGDPKLKAEDFAGCPCWIAIDLGFVDDIASVIKVIVKDEKVHFFGRHYLPEETVEDSRNSQYAGWVRMKRITTTDGAVTDTETILDDLLDDMGKFDIQEIVFDPYNKLTLINPMQKRGASIERMAEFPQTVAAMSPATEGLMKAVRAREVKHDGCPVLAWAMSNVVGHFDAKENVYPRKERPENKIDPALAAIMAYGSMLRMEETTFSYTGLRSVG